MAWQKTRISVPSDLTPRQREDLGFDILEFIRDRSADGKGLSPTGRTNKLFPKYSDSYIDSLDFRIAGKSKDSVNLQLSGDMLDDMDVLSTSKGSVLIGFENGSENNDKAEGNKLGSYGRTPNKDHARNFLGITKTDLKIVVEKFRRDHGL